MVHPGVERPTVRAAPAYWLAGKRLPERFRPWLAERVQRDDYKIILRRRTILTFACLLLVGVLIGSSSGVAVAVVAVGMAVYTQVRTKEPTSEQKSRLLAWHGVTSEGEPCPPDSRALTGPLTRKNTWPLLGWALFYVVLTLVIHEVTGLRLYL